MNDRCFNTSLRRFLKRSASPRSARSKRPCATRSPAGRLKGHEKLPAKMVLTIGGVSLSHEITDEIELG